MLKEILIRNFAIIDTLDLTLSEGFNVFTGETGAGKSIILDAVSAVLGEKTDASFVREGKDRASVEAVFTLDIHQKEILAILEREDFISDDENKRILTLTREIRSNGRSIARVNGHSANIAVMHEIGELLVDIHGQSEHLSLLKPDSHLRLVDLFAGNQPLLSDYRVKYKELIAIQKELKEVRFNEQDALRRKDMLTFQINEIQSASLNVGEEEKLTLEREKLVNIERLIKNVQRSLIQLEGDGNEMPGIMDLMAILAKSFETLNRYDETISAVNERLTNVFEEINEIYDFLQRYKEDLEFNPRRLNQIEERLMLIETLKRKYGADIPAIQSFLENAKESLTNIENADEKLAKLSEKEASLKQTLSEMAIVLSRKRRNAADAIASSMEKELLELRMPSAKFKVDFQHTPSENGLSDENGRTLAYSESGFDRAEFLIAPNLGEGLKPLVKIASGGETARLMLALKNTLAQADDIPTMVFDEIDQGIGGRVGSVVGQKLWRISNNHQVLCITHLPQLAAYYDAHYRVRKVLSNGRTETLVERLEGHDSLEEIAALLGGVSEENISAANAMMHEADAFKSELGQSLGAAP